MSNNPMMNAVQGFAKKARVVGIIISIALIIIGILAFFMPARTSILIAWLFLAGLVAYGVYEIVRYAKTAAAGRQIWDLVTGILCIVLGIVAILATGKPGKVLLLSMGLCFMLITTGIGRLSLSSALKKEGKTNTGMLTFSGVLDLICALFMIISPFAMTFAYEFIMGIYLVIGGISLLTEILSEAK